MKKLLSMAAAVSVTFAMTACSKDEPTTPTASLTTATATDSPSTSDTPSQTTSEAPTATTSGAPTGTGTNAAPAGKVDQTSPEAAMTSWLNAMVGGHGTNVCGLMASGGQAISQIPNALETCHKTIEPMLHSVTALADMFKGLSVSGATITGDTATFESATTTPAMAKQVISMFKAVKIKDKWYVTQ